MCLCLAFSASAVIPASAQTHRLDGHFDDRFFAPWLVGMYKVIAADPEHVYVAGRVEHIPEIEANGIARWDGIEWHPLGSGIEGTVRAMAIGPNGTLFIGGEISRAGEVEGATLVRWDGSSWESPGDYNGIVAELVVSDKGIGCVGYAQINAHGGLYIEGDGVSCVGPDAPPKPVGIIGVISLASGPGDTLFAVGMGEKSLQPYLAFWDGQSWSSEEIDEAPDPLEYADGKLYGVIDGSIHIRNSEEWTKLMDLPDVYSATYAGSLSRQPFYVAGSRGAELVIFKLEDDEWSIISDSLRGSKIESISLDTEGRLYAAGDFQHRNRPHISGFAWWDGERWNGLKTVGQGMSTWVAALQAMPDGCMYAGGDFTFAGSTPAQGFACWDGVKWNGLRSGDALVPEFVSSIKRLPNGTMYVTGNSNQEEHGSRIQIFKRVDSEWSIIPEPRNGALAEGDLHVREIAIHVDGTLYAAGALDGANESAIFGIAQWDGNRWRLIGSGGERQADEIVDMVVRPDGSLIVGGEFQQIAHLETSGLAMWDGETWHAFGSGIAHDHPYVRVNAVAFVADTLYIGGSFREIDGVPADFAAYWDGAEWREMGGGTTGAVEVFSPTHDGDLLVGGRFGSAGGTTMNNVALWEDGEWKTLNRGVTGAPHTAVVALAESYDGSIFIGGRFEKAGGTLSYALARWIPSDITTPRLGNPSRDGAPYPNPARGEFYVPVPGDLNGAITMYDLLGRERLRQEFEEAGGEANYVILPTDDLASGTYIVRVETPGQNELYTIVILR